MRRRAVPAGLAGLVLLAGCAGPAAAPVAQGPIRYPVSVSPVAQSATGAASLVVAGDLVPSSLVAVIAPLDGQVERLAVVEGQTVVAGQTLLAIDGERLRLERLKAAADLDRARRALDLAQAAESRRNRLSAGDAALLSDEERQESQARSAQARAEVDRAEATLALASLALDRATLRAPVAGTVVGLEVGEAARVAAGRRLLGVLQAGPPQVAFRVPADLVPRIQVGNQVQIQPGGGAPVTGTIISIAQTADASRQVGVRALLSVAGHRPGGLALVRVSLPLGPGLAVPRSALRASDRGMLAFVHHGDRVRQRQVETGLTSDDGWCEVVTGLSEGEAVVVAGIDALRDGAPVRLVAVP